MKKLIIFLFLANMIFANVLDFKTIQSDFIQSITDEQNSTITYKGEFYATDKSKALWIYKSPVEKKIYFNNNKVVIIEPELEQAIITTLQNSSNITQIIKNAVKLSEDTYKASFEDTDYIIKIKDNEIKSINYTDSLGNSIKISLLHVNKNIILDDALFEADIPSYYDIISQ